MAALGMALAAGIALAAVRLDTARPVTKVVAPPAAPAVASPSPVPSPEPVPHDWPAFARVQGLRLILPVRSPVLVAYHQASFETALELHPLGHLERNYNRFLFDAPADTPGPAYIVMSARGRGTPATSAADVMVRARAPIRSPVTGHVVSAEPYRLYCRYTDWRLVIAPRGHPDLRVVMIHLTNVQVGRGDRVFATLSVIGNARSLPFRSQVDDYVTGGDPHVHIEVKESARTSAPAC